MLAQCVGPVRGKHSHAKRAPRWLSFVFTQDAERREEDRAKAAQVLANEEAERVKYLAKQEEAVRRAEEELRAKYAEMTAKLERQQVRRIQSWLTRF